MRLTMIRFKGLHLEKNERMKWDCIMGLRKKEKARTNGKDKR